MMNTLIGLWLLSKNPEPVKVAPIKLNTLPSQRHKVHMTGLSSGVHIPKPTNYNPCDITEKSNLIIPQVDKLLQGTEISSLASTFLKAEQEYNINAYFLIGLVAQESGWGTSNFARTRNNLTGYCAYTNSPNDAMYFSSKEENILTTARHIRKNYLNCTGVYHQGVSIWDINKSYSIPGWGDAINQIIYEMREKE